MFKRKILIAIDEPRWAYKLTQTLCDFIDRENSEIVFLNVLETTIAEEEYFYNYPEKFIKIEARKANFAYVENLLEKNKFKYEFIFKEGNAAENIINAAKELDIDMVVVGSHNKKNIEKLLLGSVAQKVAKLCKSAVMVISNKYQAQKSGKPNYNILFAVDHSKPSFYAAENLDKLIDIKKANITILNATVPPQNVIPPDAYIYVDLENIILEAKLVSEELLNNIAGIVQERKPYSIKQVSLIGDPGSLILDYAQENFIDLIVMGSHGKKDLPALVLGSVSIKILEKAEFPLLLIKEK
ncbi:MAG TPA: universal stress protein [Candidatus Gastranaerophilales bacterium]|nr:universal stress protein [Candidatus Gastranaerophilales bacterium]